MKHARRYLFSSIIVLCILVFAGSEALAKPAKGLIWSLKGKTNTVYLLDLL